jgi:hypothetical protein
MMSAHEAVTNAYQALEKAFYAGDADTIAGMYTRTRSPKTSLGSARMSPTSGTFTTYLGELRRNGLIEVQGKMAKASRELFPEHPLKDR